MPTTVAETVGRCVERVDWPSNQHSPLPVRLCITTLPMNVRDYFDQERRGWSWTEKMATTRRSPCVTTRWGRTSMGSALAAAMAGGPAAPLFDDGRQNRHLDRQGHEAAQRVPNRSSGRSATLALRRRGSGAIFRAIAVAGATA
jgi:hypothetical protein